MLPEDNDTSRFNFEGIRSFISREEGGKGGGGKASGSEVEEEV